MKYLLRTLLILALSLLFQHSALAAGSLKVGVLDLQRCIKESNEGKRAYEVLKKKHESMQKKLDQRQQELVNLQKEIEKQSLMLSLDARADKQKEFERLRRDLGYLLQDLNDEMNKAEAASQQEIIKGLEGIIKTIGEKGNYDLIIEKRNGGLLFSTEGLDITSSVIEEYNKIKP